MRSGKFRGVWSRPRATPERSRALQEDQKRSRRGSRDAKRAPSGHQEATKRATRSPDIPGVLGFSHTKETKNKTTLKARYHRCSRAINKPQAGTKRAQREPPDHKLSAVFLVFRTRERLRMKQHRKQAITGVLVQSTASTRAPRRHNKSQ